MTDQHLITPPPELIQKWWDGTHGAFYEFEAVTTQAASWGADQELEACIKLLSDHGGDGEMIRRNRRPRPKSLAEEALETLMQADGADHPVPVLVLPADKAAKIRRALKRLQELEGQGQLNKESI